VTRVTLHDRSCSTTVSVLHPVTEAARAPRARAPPATGTGRRPTAAHQAEPVGAGGWRRARECRHRRDLASPEPGPRRYRAGRRNRGAARHLAAAGPTGVAREVDGPRRIAGRCTRTERHGRDPLGAPRAPRRRRRRLPPAAAATTVADSAPAAGHRDPPSVEVDHRRNANRPCWAATSASTVPCSHVRTAVTGALTGSTHRGPALDAVAGHAVDLHARAVRSASRTQPCDGDRRDRRPIRRPDRDQSRAPVRQRRYPHQCHRVRVHRRRGYQGSSCPR
jgi:hypothetical protein